MRELRREKLDRIMERLKVGKATGERHCERSMEVWGQGGKGVEGGIER